MNLQLNVSFHRSNPRESRFIVVLYSKREREGDWREVCLLLHTAVQYWQELVYIAVTQIAPRTRCMNERAEDTEHTISARADQMRCRFRSLSHVKTFTLLWRRRLSEVLWWMSLGAYPDTMHCQAELRVASSAQLKVARRRYKTFMIDEILSRETCDYFEKLSLYSVCPSLIVRPKPLHSCSGKWQTLFFLLFFILFPQCFLILNGRWYPSLR